MSLNKLKKISKEFEKKIAKTKEARSGKGIYKRRNSRSYRVIINLSTYKKITEEDHKKLKKYKRGYAVRVNPEEYFNEDGTKKEDFPDSLELGKNAFIYFKRSDHWKKYGDFCSDFEEVVELFTDVEANSNLRGWLGEYCLYISNTKPQKISLICGKGDSKNRSTDFKNLKKTLDDRGINYGNKLPKQTGLGNRDIDYASSNEIERVVNQLIYISLKIPGIKRVLLERNKEIEKELIDDLELEVTQFCENNDLLDFNKLSEISAWDKDRNCPICPLCKEVIEAEKFLETATQDEGREEEDNTQSEIALMHIKALAPGEFNHCTYNLGWGHKHCNTIQGPASIEETLVNIQRILKNNKPSNS